ncbi:MAG: sigma-70 family RNA polymerase sigma factor [Myxococcota bacterium]
MERSDIELLDAWQSGEGDAGATLYARYFELVRNLLRGKTAEEEDVLQRVFECLARSRGAMEIRTSFRAYLAAIARNELIKHLRERAKDPQDFDPQMASAESLMPSPSEVVARRAEHQVLLMALLRIPLDAQILLELHYWEHMSTAELGEAYDVPRSTVKSRLQRARRQLEDQFRAMTLDPTLAEHTTRNIQRWVHAIREQANWELGR